MMNIRLVISCILAVAQCKHVSVNDDKEWNIFKEKYGVFYATPEVDAQRKEIFVENKKRIDEHNSLYEQGLKTYKLECNRFTDKAPHEVKKSSFKPVLNNNKLIVLSEGPIQFEATGKTLPDFVDWRKENAVSPVKNQFNCLACWAFASTDAIESQYALEYGKHLLVSQQQLVDCSGSEGNLGCRGGMVDWGYKYIIKSGGVVSEKDYPYADDDGTCMFNESKIVATINNYGEVKNGSEISLQEAVAFFGPISVSIDSNVWDWNYYKTGIFDSPLCTTEVDHAVLVVGYGTENGIDYWLVKNSYGDSYGDNGYIKMVRNKNNQCAIASYANFPIVGDWSELENSLGFGKQHYPRV